MANIIERGKVIVYRHRRLDTNEIFYVGIASNYSRPFNKSSRTQWWKKIVNKTKYEVEIIAENLIREDALELERFLIQLYGRKDLGLGPLVNMTDGGDSDLNISEETKIKISNALKGRKLSNEHIEKCRNRMLSIKHSDKTKNKMSMTRKGKTKPYKDRLILNLETGVFHYTVNEASEVYNINYHTLNNYLKGLRKNKTNLKFV
jgi:hypothetical protein